MAKDLSVRNMVVATRAVLPSRDLHASLEKTPKEYQPGRMPTACYEGIWAHHLIGLHYLECNPGHDILLDDSIEGILVSEGFYEKLPRRLARIRPDIHDKTLYLIWEIKSLKSQWRGPLQLEEYRNALGPGIYVQLGGPGRGAEGKVLAPGGYIAFEVILPGVIRYTYILGRTKGTKGDTQTS